MSVIGDFSIPAESFALEEALAALPKMTAKGDRLASHSTMEVLPFLWVTATDDSLESALKSDRTVEDVTVAEVTDDATLFRVEWVEEFKALINDMVDHHAAITEAKASEGHWDLKLRFAKEEEVSTFQQHFREQGINFEVNSLTQPTDPRQREFNLTSEQYDALVAAAKHGYFDVPRSASVDDLGDELGISANAASQRLRRGSDALVRSALTIRDESEE